MYVSLMLAYSTSFSCIATQFLPMKVATTVIIFNSPQYLTTSSTKPMTFGSTDVLAIGPQAPGISPQGWSYNQSGL